MADLFDEADALFGAPAVTATPVATPFPRTEAVTTSSGQSSLLSSLSSYIPSLETIAQESAGLAGSLTGGKFGALAGAPLAPFTFGLSVPVGGVLGGALGYLGGSTLGKAGAELAAGEEADIAKIAEAQVEPALVGAGVETGLMTLGPIGRGLAAAGKGAKRAAYGFRAGDYAKTLGKRQAVKTAEGETISLTQQQADNVIEKGFLGTSSSPSKQLNTLDASIDEANQAISTLLKNVDEPVKTPQFIDVVKANQKGVFGAENERLYASKIGELKSKLSTLKGSAKLEYMQEQKKFYGSKYDPMATGADGKFNRAMYHELQAAIERYAPEVKALNKDLQGMILTRPVIARETAKESAGMLALTNALRTAGFTTGGIFGAGAQNVLGPVGGAALGLGGAFLSSRTGRRLLASALEGTGTILPEIAGAAQPLAAATRGLMQPSEAAMQAPIAQPTITEAAATPTVDVFNEAESLFAAPEPSTVTIGKQDVSIPQGEGYAPPDLVKAVIEVESAGKPKAVSSKGAAGLMQLMPATAKDLGVEDRFDPEQNIEGGSRYLQQMISKYGETDIALAAYNWGPSNIDRAIKKVKADGKRVTWANIMQAVKVPQETRLYVNKVLSKEETLTEKTSPSLLRTVASFAPVTGEIISAQDAINALQEGEYSNAAINALGVIPAIGLFNRIRKGAKLVDAVSDVTKAAPLTEADILYNRANKALRDIDINSLTNSLKSKQTLQNTYAELVEKTRARLTRGYNKGKPKSWIDEQVTYLNENKAKLDAITTEINDTQQLLQNVIGLKQVK